MRLLVVDRDRMFVEAIAAVVGEHDDIDVVGTALSGTDAMRMTIDLEPEVVTTGYKLPDEDGVALSIRLRAHRESVKVVLVSRFEHGPVLEAAMVAGCSGFVSKSAPLSDFVTTARAVMTGQVVIPPALLANMLGNAGIGPHWRGTSLSPMELQILKHFPEGLTDREIGERIGLSVRSVRNHVESILGKLDSHSKLQGLATAIRRGVILLKN